MPATFFEPFASRLERLCFRLEAERSRRHFLIRGGGYLIHRHFVFQAFDDDVFFHVGNAALNL